jgi:hypothetical protein
MKPVITSECRRGQPIGSSPDRRQAAFALVFVGTPFLLGVAGCIMSIAAEALGPLVTLTVWLALLFVPAVRRQLSFVEWLAVSGCLLMLQLLLDLHTPHAGDVVVAAVHVAGMIALAAGFVVGRIRRRPR